MPPRLGAPSAEQPPWLQTVASPPSPLTVFLLCAFFGSKYPLFLPCEPFSSVWFSRGKYIHAVVKHISRTFYLANLKVSPLHNPTPTQPALAAMVPCSDSKSHGVPATSCEQTKQCLCSLVTGSSPQGLRGAPMLLQVSECPPKAGSHSIVCIAPLGLFPRLLMGVWVAATFWLL